MKKLISVLFLLIILAGCSDFEPNRISDVKVDVTGSAERILVVVAYTSGDSTLSTSYNNVRLPFDLNHFPLNGGDVLAVGVLNWENSGEMNIEIRINGELVQQRNSTTEASLRIEMPR